MCACKSEHSWIVPEGLCPSLFLPHSLGTAIIQPMNGQGFNYSPHLSDQIQLENEGNPRQAQSLLCSVRHGRGHPAPATRDYFPPLFHDPFGKQGLQRLEIHYGAFHIVCGLCTGSLIFLMMHWASGSPLFPQGHWWPLCMPESFPYCFLTYMLPSLCAFLLPLPLYVSHMTDWLLTLPGQPEFDIVKADGPQVEDMLTRNKVVAN